MWKKGVGYPLSRTKCVLSMTSNVTYCDLKGLQQNLKDYSEYLVFIICICGCISNCFNICVLSRKQMQCPTNYILLRMAVVDMLVMLDYMPFSYLMTQQTSVYIPYYYSHYFAVYVILHTVFSQTLHFISCCLTIILALWRYIAVKFPQNNRKWCSPKMTKWTIFLVYILCPIICIPIFLSHMIVEKTAHVFNNHTFVLSKPNDTNTTSVIINYVTLKDGFYKLISLYTYGVLVKLVPCILLTILSVLIIIELLAAKKRMKKLMNPVTKDADGLVKKKPSQRVVEKEKQAHRTTKMLLAVLLLFLLVEFPQAIYGLLIVIIGDDFQAQCYNPIGKTQNMYKFITIIYFWTGVYHKLISNFNIICQKDGWKMS